MKTDKKQNPQCRMQLYSMRSVWREARNLTKARQNDYKDEIVLIIISAPIVVLAYGVFSNDPEMMDKIDLFFHHFSALPIWFQTLWITVVASIFGIKGTQIFRNGGAKKK